MQQLAFVGISPRSGLPDLERMALPSILVPLQQPLSLLQEAYTLVLNKLKQPSANHPNPSTKVWDAVEKFSTALRSVEIALYEKVGASSNHIAASRVHDAVGALWSTLGKYAQEAVRGRVRVACLRAEMENVYGILAELASQEARL